MQKQVDFLKLNSAFFGIVTKIERRTNENKTRSFSSANLKFYGKKFTIKDYLNGINYPINAFMYKNFNRENWSTFSIILSLRSYIDY